eukprot:TRINITY_DN59944_c0_g1_i1.p1 TRINITY_DN59944_c0_g1~~TRINITY_DN59944_c0_g1_i1.p1  ORF type:complete len:1796 (+),score=840.25 TRINITY_DN59944_c0_g1_i1:110-5389(+)
MQLRHQKTLHPATPQGVARITSCCWSPNNRRLAVADHFRFVHLFDEHGEKRDRFATKPAENRGPKTYVVRGMCFSPDSAKLAIAQSDNIVFVYKLGVEWGEKKSICNKFLQQAPVTCCCWPHARGNELLVFGVSGGINDGKVRIGTLVTNKCRNLYSTDSYVVSICPSPDGTGLLSGHLDGSVYRYYFEEQAGMAGSQKLCVTPGAVPPQALGWGESIAAAGNDCKLHFYDQNGRLQQSFTFDVEQDKEFSCLQFNPSGQSLAVGAYNRFRVFNYSNEKRKWEEGNHKQFENLYAITCMAWKYDGSRLVCCSLCGAVDMFDACIKRYRYKGKFEFTYVSHSQVIVKRLSTGTRIVLKSQFGYKLLRVNIYKDQFLVAHSDQTLLVGALATCKLSEVQWLSEGHEKFVFDNPQVCMIFNAGELALVEYGRNEILGSCRTSHIQPHLISVRINDTPDMDEDRRLKIIAYLIDKQSIRVLDLVSGIPQAMIHHSSKVDWLELNKRATKLLFRDKSRQLYIYDIAHQTKTTLLNYCSYVQWVPDSDVVVAQNRGDLCVWYSIDTPDRVAIVPIKGDVEDIERSEGKTEVIVDEGINTVAYGLDEALIEFGTAMEDKDYERACDLLEQITITPETEAMWQNLSQYALDDKKLHIAERCFAALGDVAKARALMEINETAKRAVEEKQVLEGQGMEHYLVRAKLAMLQKNFKAAETILLEHHQVDKAVEMWDDLFRFDESIAVAAAKQHPDTDKWRKKYFEWLMETKQQDLAAELREKEHKYADAINLYLQGGLPARAAHVVNAYQVQIPQQQQEAIATALFKAQMFEKAGDFFEKLNLNERAVDAYRKGRAYRRAVDLSRREFPGYVVSLEEEWGDWLVAQKQVDAAINHYMEAGQFAKAIDAAINSRQWTKAVQILDTQAGHDPAVLRNYKIIATHYEDARQFSEAEKYFLKAQLPREAVQMYTRNNMWDQAHKVAKMYMSEQQISDLYVEQAHQLELQGKFKDAERLYVKIQEPDLAIHMYKKARKYDDMIRLVSQYRRELLSKTHLTLAQLLEKEQNYRQAEYHYIQAKPEKGDAVGQNADGPPEGWKAAVNMYRQAKQWEDAIRVAKVNGGAQAWKNVVIAWALELGGEQGSKLLTRFGMVEQAIEYCISRALFDAGFELAQRAMPSMVSQVHLKHAMFLEDEGHFKEAEDEFVKAGKPKEAIDMYIHCHNWPDAMRVANIYEPAAVPQVLIAEANFAFERKDYQHAERFLLEANEPEMLVNLYKGAGMFPEAERIAQAHAPHLVTQLRMVQVSEKSPIDAARVFDESQDFPRAIDEYLKVTKEHGSVQACVNAWTRCFQLCYNHQRERLLLCLSVIAPRMMDVMRHEQAGQLYEQIEDYRGAVDIYIKGGKWDKSLWDKAEKLAGNVSADLAEYVRKQRLEHLRDTSDGTDIEKMDPAAGLEFYMDSNQWEKAMELACKRDEDTRLECAARWISYLVDEGQAEKCLDVVSKHGISLDFQFYAIFAKMGKAILPHLKAQGAVQDLLPLRVGLWQLVQQMRKTGQPQEQIQEMETYLNIVHRYAMAPVLRADGFPEYAAKNIISLARYAGILPCDKAFFDAGMAARDVGQKNTAFVMLNRFLDISELQEEDAPRADGLDHSDFENSDIPYDFPIPKESCVDPELSEAARQWVLTQSMDKDLEQALPTQKCVKCQHENWTGSLACKNCGFCNEGCVITGFPVTKMVRCRACQKAASQDDWNKYIMKKKHCPWCGSPQSTVFGV